MMRWREIRVNGLGGGLLLSLFLHGLIAAVLLFDLPRPMAEPEPPEEVVAVTIVPPPEPEPEPEQEEPAPEPAAEPEPPEAAAAEPPPPPSLPEGGAVPIPVLRPVFEFGEEDRGPEIALDGGAAQAPATDPAETQPDEPAAAPETAAEPEPEPETTAEVPPEPETAAEVTPEADAPVEEPVETPPETVAEEPAEAPVEQPAPAPPAEIAVPDGEQAGDQPAGLPETAEQTETARLPEKPAEPVPSPPEPDPARPKPSRSPDAKAVAPVDAAPAVDNGLPGVRKLSSGVDTGHAVATTAMGALPRDVRGSQLCTTELREQLRRAPEPYRVELLPSYRLPGGTVLNVPKAAFRAGGAWYNLSFRCTVDADALRVTAFSFKVGAPVPRTQWRQRGFPEF